MTAVILENSVLVKSHTKPGIWYEVSDSCPCEGFVHRGHCSHIDEARNTIHERLKSVGKMAQEMLPKTPPSDGDLERWVLEELNKTQVDWQEAYAEIKSLQGSEEDAPVNP